MFVVCSMYVCIKYLMTPCVARSRDACQIICSCVCKCIGSSCDTACSTMVMKCDTASYWGVKGAPSVAALAINLLRVCPPHCGGHIYPCSTFAMSNNVGGYAPYVTPPSAFSKSTTCGFFKAPPNSGAQGLTDHGPCATASSSYHRICKCVAK